MRFTPLEYMNWLARQHKPGASKPSAHEGTKSESELHQQIIHFCKCQLPPWKFIRCRMDLPSSIQVGAHDFTIYASGGRVFNVECKTQKGKLSSEQKGWAMELDGLGHVVYVVRSMVEFMEVVR